MRVLSRGRIYPPLYFHPGGDERHLDNRFGSEAARVDDEVEAAQIGEVPAVETPEVGVACVIFGQEGPAPLFAGNALVAGVLGYPPFERSAEADVDGAGVVGKDEEAAAAEDHTALARGLADEPLGDCAEGGFAAEFRDRASPQGCERRGGEPHLLEPASRRVMLEVVGLLEFDLKRVCDRYNDLPVDEGRCGPLRKGTGDELAAASRFEGDCPDRHDGALSALFGRARSRERGPSPPSCSIARKAGGAGGFLEPVEV